MMLGFYSVDITITEEGRPFLIELNGSNSGFDGFLIAYNDTNILDAINAIFTEWIGDKEVFLVTRLINFGELPRGYLDKLVQDVLYFKSVENVHAMLPKGIPGTTWARMRTDRPPSTLGAGASIDKLIERYPRFKKVMLNVANPSYVISEKYFREQADFGLISFKEQAPGVIQARTLKDQDVLWIRCPTLAFSETITKGIIVNPEFPYNAVAANKLFTYEVLSRKFSENLPLSIPIGNRCSGSSVIDQLLAHSKSELFIRKPLLGSQARGIEILRRQDVEDYMRRVTSLEQADSQYSGEELPLELRGVPELHVAWALSFDVSLLSELKPSKPVYCIRTGRHHHGCMRTLALLKVADNGTMEVRFLGAYWRLAPVPIGGDGLLWERYIGSQSQGAFCEKVSSEDLNIAEQFAKEVLSEYYRNLSEMPRERQSFEEWEKGYWLDRYREQVPFLNSQNGWKIFIDEIRKAEDEASRLKQQAEQAGFRRVPSAFLTRDQVVRARLPYLIREPYRIIIPQE